MEEAKEKLIPGMPTTYIDRNEKGFAKIEMMISVTGGLSLSQVCTVTGLEGTTIQNWVKRGWVKHPQGKKYEEVHVARILIINALKDCIKLEHISLLMDYVNGMPEDNSSVIIKESELFNYLCDALQIIGKADDLSRVGVEAVADKLIKDYEGAAPGAKDRIRKALIVMIYACVCTDVKRRTDAMMGQVLKEIKTERSKILSEKSAGIEVQKTSRPESVSEPRKTVSQALREWDLSTMETILNEEQSEDEETPQGDTIKGQPGNALKNLERQIEASAAKPVYFRKG